MDDEILEINGRTVEGMNANEVADMMVTKVIFFSLLTKGKYITTCNSGNDLI